MLHYKITVKETNGQVCHPEFRGNKTRREIIEFFGLEEPDVEWYKIEVLHDDETNNE